MVEHRPAPLSSSFRDPSGFVFRSRGEVFRHVGRAYQPDYDRLLASGLYDELVASGLLIPHEEVREPELDPSTAYKTLRPEPIPFISYPYEWSFGALRDAALATLAIEKKALALGQSLKDASAFNIQFRDARPVLIDTLSFESYTEGRPWVAYKQFCTHFLAPLALMSLVDVRLGRLSQAHLDGVPLDLAARLLPWSSRLRPSLLLHIHAHAGSQKKHGSTEGRRPDSVSTPKSHFSRRSMLGLIDALEAAIHALPWHPPKTEWIDYTEHNSYSERALEEKARIVSGLIAETGPTSVWDLGANTGRFSRLASARGIETISFDIDPLCVEENYRRIRREDERNLLPLCVDLLNPSPPIGWRNRERMTLEERGPTDLALALALVHHLTIGGGLPIGRVASFFAAICRTLIVEFVPPDDPQSLRLLSARTVTHQDHDRDSFERAFRDEFTIDRRLDVAESGRSIYLMKKRRS